MNIIIDNILYILTMKKELLKMNSVFFRQICWYIPLSSLFFFQFTTTCNTIYKHKARSGETYSWRAICLRIPKQNFSTSDCVTGRGSCTPELVAFLKKAHGRVVCRKVDFAESNSLNFFTYRATVVDEIVACDPSPFAIYDDRSI